VIWVDFSAQDESQAKRNVDEFLLGPSPTGCGFSVERNDEDGNPISQHTEAYEARIGPENQVYSQRTGAYVDNGWPWENNHGRIFGPYRKEGEVSAYYTVASFSREDNALTIHEFVGFNRARNRLSRTTIDIRDRPTCNNPSWQQDDLVPLANQFPDEVSDDENLGFTTADHDGALVFVKGVLPDLQVLSVSGVDAAAGRSMELQAEVAEENGLASFSPSENPVLLRFMLSRDQIDWDSYLLCEEQVVVGGEIAATCPVPAEMPAGNYYLLARVDPDHRVQESAEYNNLLASSSMYSIHGEPPSSDELFFLAQPSGVDSPNNVFPASYRIFPAIEVEVPEGWMGEVVLSLGNDPCGGATLTGSGPVTPVDGTAIFENVVVNPVCDGYTVVASSEGLSIVESGPFNVTVPGDLNLDGRVDVMDLGILLSAWGKTSYPPADIDKNGIVDDTDQDILLSNWAGEDPQVRFLSQPSDVAFPDNVFAAGQRIYPAIEVGVPDEWSGEISLSLGSNPCGGTLSGGGPVVAVGGRATFDEVTIDGVCAGYTLVASADGFESAESAPFAITIPGDLNVDGRVDQIDQYRLTELDWGKTTYSAADINKDGLIDVIDLGIQLSNWTGGVMVATQAPTDIQNTSAMLNGTVSSPESGEVWFEWSTTSDLTEATASDRQAVTAGASEAAFSIPVSDLTAGRTYYYRAAVETNNGIAKDNKSNVQSFTTSSSCADDSAGSFYAQSYVTTLPSRLFTVSISACGTDNEVGLIHLGSGEGIRVEEIARGPSGTVWAYSNGSLYSVNTATAEATVVGPTGSIAISSLALDADGLLIGTSGYIAAPQDDYLVRLNPETGTIEESISLGTWGITGDIAFAPDGDLFAIGVPDFSSRRYLVTIDRNTGAVTNINGAAPVPYELAGLTFVGNQLYGVTLDERLVKLDTATAEIAYIRELSFPAGGAAVR